ncbi:MAG: hypothetical protein E6K88_07680 [Thaumarchaeota archaeon]|nr:MAG: hypothetical protein E6K88_07680 [Nitrososphaerota archaeon]
MMITSKLAEGLGISAMVLLMIVMVLDIGIGTGTIKPPVGQQVLGPVLGLPSIILFLASFGVGYMVAGGIIYISFLLLGTITHIQFLYYANPNVFYSIFVLGCVILGLGIFRLIKTTHAIKQPSAVSRE